MIFTSGIIQEKCQQPKCTTGIRTLSVPAVHKLKITVYGMISRNAIFPRSMRKKKRRSTGLPGKLPVNRLVTTVVPPRCSMANGSLV